MLLADNGSSFAFCTVGTMNALAVNGVAGTRSYSLVVVSVATRSRIQLDVTPSSTRHSQRPDRAAGKSGAIGLIELSDIFVLRFEMARGGRYVALHGLLNGGRRNVVSPRSPAQKRKVEADGSKPTVLVLAGLPASGIRRFHST